MSSDSAHSLIPSPSCCSGVTSLSLRYGNEIVGEVEEIVRVGGGGRGKGG